MKFFCFAFLRLHHGGERFKGMGGGDITVIGYGFMVEDDLPGMSLGVTISIDAPMHGASRKLG